MEPHGEGDAPEILARSLERARRWEDAGLWEEAAQIYAWLMERFPEAPERSQWEAGYQRCRKRLQLEADWTAAEEADRAGDWEAARAALRRIVEQDPEFQRGGRVAHVWLEDLERKRAARQRRYRAFTAVFGFVLAALGCGAGIALAAFVWHSAAGLFPSMPSPAPTSLILETPSPSPSPVPPAENEPPVFSLPAMPLSAAPERIAVLARWGTEGVPAGAALSPDGRWIAFPIGNRVEWLEASTLRPVRTLEIPAADSISRLAFSPDGRWFAVGTEGGRIYLGPVAGQALVHALAPKRRQGLVESLAFSPDSAWLAAGQPGEVDLWAIPVASTSWELPASSTITLETTLRISLSSFRVISLERDPSRIFDLMFAPDGRTLIAASAAGAIHFLDPRTGWEIRRLEPGGAWVIALARSPDGALMAAGDSEGRISIWRLTDGTMMAVLSGHTGAVTTLAFLPDGSALLSGGTDRTLRVWSLKDRTGKVWYEDRIAWVDRVEVTTDGRVMASFSDGHLRIWRWPDGQPEREIQRPSGMYPRALAFDPAGRWLAAGFADGTLRIWPISSTRPLATWGAHTLWIDRIAFHPEGQWLASTGMDGRIYVWSLPEGRRIAAFEGDPGWPSDLTITPDGEFLIAGGYDLRIYRFSLRTGEREMVETGFLRIQDEAGRRLSYPRIAEFGLRSLLALSPDGQLLAMLIPFEGEIVLDSAAAFGRSPRRFQIFPEWSAPGTAMAFSPDGRWLFVGTRAEVERFPIPEGSPADLLIREPVLSMAISRQGDLLALGGFSGRIDLIRLPDGMWVRTLYGHRGEPVIALAISPDGRLLASGGEDGTITLWGVR